MGLEIGTMPSDLNTNWPLETDQKVEGPAHMRLTKLAVKNIAALQRTLAQAVITNQPANTVTVVGTGSDTLVPPTGYVQVPGIISDIALNGIVIGPTGVQLPVAGYYRIDGWLACKTSAAAATLAVVFGSTRDGVTTYSARPTPSEVAGGNELTLISGGGFLAAQPGDLITVHIASSHSGTVTIPNANLRFQWMAPL